MGGLVAIPALSTDVALPAYGATAAVLGTTESAIALTLSFFMLGFAAGPFLYGPLSGRLGRKPVLLAGLTLYFLSSLLCTLTSSLWLLLAARLVQGVAAASGTLVTACIRDLYDGLTGRKQTSVVMIINGLMPLAGPSLGVVILALGGWRSVYGTMTLGGLLLILGVAFGMPETLRRKNPHPLSPRQLFRDYREVVCHPLAIRACLINAASFGMLFAYISGSPLLYLGTMHVSQAVYAVAFAVPAIGSMAGTFVYNRLLSYGVTPRKTLHLGLALMLIVTASFFVLMSAHRYWLSAVVTLLTGANFAMGMTGPNVGYTSVQYLPHLAGEAAAVLAGTQMIVASLSASLVAVLYGAFGPTALAAVMFGFSLVAGVVHVTTPREIHRPTAA